MANVTPMRLSASMLTAILLRPSTCAFGATALTSQKRLSSGISRLTKLHRKQKAALREEKAQSAYRAAFVAPPSLTSSSTSQTTASTDSSTSFVSQSSIPYYVTRTKSNGLPVYLEAKAGGTKHLTLIRKISGDLAAFKDDLMAALPPLTASGPPGAIRGEADGLSESALQKTKKRAKPGKETPIVNINFTTGHLVVKGWRKQEVEKFLTDRGF